jgi:hypothetical protein
MIKPIEDIEFQNDQNEQFLFQNAHHFHEKSLTAFNYLIFKGFSKFTRG